MWKQSGQSQNPNRVVDWQDNWLRLGLDIDHKVFHLSLSRATDLAGKKRPMIMKTTVFHTLTLPSITHAIEWYFSFKTHVIIQLLVQKILVSENNSINVRIQLFDYEIPVSKRVPDLKLCEH